MPLATSSSAISRFRAVYAGKQIVDSDRVFQILFEDAQNALVSGEVHTVESLARKLFGFLGNSR